MPLSLLASLMFLTLASLIVPVVSDPAVVHPALPMHAVANISAAVAGIITVAINVSIVVTLVFSRFGALLVFYCCLHPFCCWFS